MDQIMQKKNQQNLRIIALICARGGSKGVPRKNICPLAGKPLIVHTIDAAKACPFFDEIVVSTDDEEIAHIAKEAGAAVPTLRPAELASDTAGKFDVFVHALSMVDEHFGAQTDILVDLDATTPFRNAKDIQKCVGVLLEDQKADSVVTATVSQNSPYFNMFEEDEQGYAHVSKKIDRPIVRRQDAPNVYQLNAAVLAMRRNALLEKKKVYTDRSRVCVIDDGHAVMIDTPTDFEFAEFMAARPNNKNSNTNIIEEKKMQGKLHIAVQGRRIGPGEPCFIIAEAGSNHNGDIGLAKRLIDVAAEAGADAVKFQRFKTEELVHKEAPKAHYQKETTGDEQNQYEMLKALEIDEKDFLELKRYAESKGLIFFVSIFDHASVKSAHRMDMPIIKVGSGDTDNIPMIRECAKTGRVIMISTGMSDMEEVRQAVRTMEDEGNRKLILFHCTSSYPCPKNEVHLLAMKTIADEFPYPVGYSDHTTSLVVPAAAAAMGASVYERHFTLDKSLPGPDHSMSADPQELKIIIQNIREIETALGSAKKEKRALEQDIIDVARKSMHACQDIPTGQVITESHIYSTRPAKGGIPPNKIHFIVGKKASRDIACHEQIREDMLE